VQFIKGAKLKYEVGKIIKLKCVIFMSDLYLVKGFHIVHEKIKKREINNLEEMK